jgi:hypothetical protein
MEYQYRIMSFPTYANHVEESPKYFLFAEKETSYLFVDVLQSSTLTYQK